MNKVSSRLPAIQDIVDCAGEDSAKAFGYLLNAGPCWTITDEEGTPIAVVGIGKPWQGMGEAWAILSPLFGHYLAAPPLVRDLLWEETKKPCYRRIQCSVKFRSPASLRFASYMGFVIEATLHEYGPNGEDIAIMRYVA